jgi:protein-L-isoaspartate(D-aspartate) O-methyltransferase
MNNNNIPYFLVLYFIFMIILFSCSGQSEMNVSGDDIYAGQRFRMVETQLIPRDITDKQVLQAMQKVPRHLFIPNAYRDDAYADGPQPIGNNQTISQPYIVAIMTQLLALDSLSRVLEIGTGSGYQAAVLGEIADSVYSIEIIPALAERSGFLLDSLGYNSIEVKCGDGYQGWPKKGPFDAIIVTAAAPKIPQPLIEQLKLGGRMVIPVGEYYQELFLITKSEEDIIKKSVIPVRFVPMTGEIQKK